VHVGESARISVRITLPTDGAPITLVQVDAIGDGRSGWKVTGAMWVERLAIRVQPEVAAKAEWVAAVTTSEGCTASTHAYRPVEFVR
jgi:hypothetical protein